MSTDSLTQTVDDWSVQVVVASQYLTALYRRLGDEKQAIRAIQSATFAEERCQRLGLHTELAKQRTPFSANRPDETEGEASAWRLVVGSQACLLAIHALLDQDLDKMAKVRGKRQTTLKGFQAALQGLRTAFPEELTTQWITLAVRDAATLCTDALLQDLEERSEALEKELHAAVLEALESGIK